MDWDNFGNLEQQDPLATVLLIYVSCLSRSLAALSSMASGI